MESEPILNKLSISSKCVRAFPLFVPSNFTSFAGLSTIATFGYPIPPKIPERDWSVFKFLAMTFPTEARVALKRYPKKRGFLVDATQAQGYCHDHDNAPKYLVKMDWNSSCWLTIIGCISYTVSLIFTYTGTKFLVSFLYKYSGLGFCISWLIHRFIFGTWFYNWNLKLFGFLSLYLGRNKLVCIQEMEEESIYDEKQKRGRGIQGFNNSCYLDAFLFSMFYASTAFDSMFNESGDFLKIEQNFSEKTKEIVRNEIRDPLRKETYVSAEQVWKLREHLKVFDSRITGSFMAIEDVVRILFEQALNSPKFIHYSMKYQNSIENHFANMHIMMVDPFDPNPVITVQKNLEASMKINGNMRFCNVPSPALILSLPWHNDKLFHHEAIIPTFELNIRNLMTNAEEVCTNCKMNIAMWEAVSLKDSNPEVVLCDCCIAIGDGEHDHTPNYPEKFVSRITMKLTALICYRGAHFTTFICKSGKEGRKDKWIRFDSMSEKLPGVVTADNLVESVNSVKQEVLINLKQLYQIQFTSSHARAFCLNGHTCIYEPIFYDSK